MIKTAIAILNYNGKNWLEKFLPTVIENSPEKSVFVIDNASTDDSVAFLKHFCTSVTLIQNRCNTGFAGGYNEGLKQIDAEYFVLLNSDVEVTPNWVEPIIEAFEKDDNLKAAQPKILAYNKKTHFEHAGAAGGFIDKYAFPFCRGRIFDHVEEDKGQYDDATEIFWATGACFFIRSKVFNEMGGFDADFFAHMEEIDLCWRIKNKGGSIKCIPQSTVYHVGGGTLDYDNPKKTFLNFRNSLYTIHKNKDGMIFFYVFRRLCIDALAGFQFLIKGKFKQFIAVIKAHFYYYGSIPKLQKKRKTITRSKFIEITAVENFSVVKESFVSKKNTFNSLYN